MAGERRTGFTDTEKTENTEKDDKKETELEKYWKAVKDNPADFTGWTYLLQYVEQENNVEDAQEAFDAFFDHYPYCYGYWKKFADILKKNDEVDKAIAVFERGVKAIPLSVELWLHYISSVTESRECENVERIQELYRKALNAAGTDFRADRLWDSVIHWEKQQKNLQNVMRLYDELLKIPLQLYSHHFDNFKSFINSHHPKEILSLDEFFKLREEVLAKRSDCSAEEEDGPDDQQLTEEAPPGVESEGGKSDEVEANKLRAKIIEIRQAVHKETEEEVSKRWAFEEGIKRPYFHVKPLERSQLKNWKDYLDFEIEFGTHERVVVLFERCLIATALYEDFWLKYARYIEQHSIEAARNVYKRACNIHLPKKPSIHLTWAAFEESQGNYDEAWKILNNLEKNIPGLAMVALRRISLERHQYNFAAAAALFQEYMDTAATKEIRSFFAIKYSRFLSKVCHDVNKAKEILKEAIEIDETNPKLHLQLLDIEYQTQPMNEDSILDTFKFTLSTNMSLQSKIKFSQRRIEFLEDFGKDITKLLDAYDEHQKVLKEAHIEKKRKMVECGEDPLEKKAKLDGGVNNNCTRANGSKDILSATSVGTTVSGNNDISNVVQQNTPFQYAHWGSYQNAASYGGYPHPHWSSYNNQYYPS
ncbi:pre-mRNA-processing factor 39 isoform X1 [Octopus bimaculoides]|uniref:Pre-mRNA-processing factor 39 n=1 Tax=Octopus bimaculoides TaxID=37653 RepID=A0A0L8FF70_OCTBM|nr:pre-mRNA-processing factor 39 isoform X1 [Octopus bimaculoides]|eukprot:XP_014790338.1 PREDICTED: pre-mRNA-processing factor 39-like isoform X1 [Octopus bimaculoides]